MSDCLSSADPNAKTYLTVKGMVADMSNETHANTTMRGLEMKILHGLLWPYLFRIQDRGNLRVGYEGGREAPFRDFKIVIDLEEAELSAPFDYLSKVTVVHLPKLNQEKIPWPGFYQRPPKGKGWSVAPLFSTSSKMKNMLVFGFGENRGPLTQQRKKVQKPRPPNEWLSHHEGKTSRGPSNHFSVALE